MSLLYKIRSEDTFNFEITKICLVMNKVLGFVLATVAFSIVLPKLIVQDAVEASETEIACSRYSVRKLVYDNGIQHLLTMNLAITDKDKLNINGISRTVLYTNIYTLFGFKYVTLATLCNSKNGQVLCASKDYSILQGDSIDPKQPCG